VTLHAEAKAAPDRTAFSLFGNHLIAGRPRRQRPRRNADQSPRIERALTTSLTAARGQSDAPDGRRCAEELGVTLVYEGKLNTATAPIARFTGSNYRQGGNADSSIRSLIVPTASLDAGPKCSSASRMGSRRSLRRPAADDRSNPRQHHQMITKGRVLATKRIILPAGAVKPEIREYGLAKHFSIRERPVGNIYELARLLHEIEKRPDIFVVRGKAAPGIKNRRHFPKHHGR
jgi:hypothetical protein